MKEKLKRAALLLMLKRHRYPGAKEWELKRYLGEHYDEVLGLLEKHLEALGLGIKCVNEGDTKHYAIIVKDNKVAKEIKAYSWRIDEMAVLAISLSYILARNEGVSEKELVNLLSEKIAKWRVERALEKFIRLGYLEKRDDRIYIGLRSKLEFDLEKLVRMVIGAEECSTYTSREEQPVRPQE